VADRVKIDTGDMKELPYPPNSFDRVSAHLVLHRLKSRADRRKALEEMNRVLKPKGWLALQDFQYLHQVKSDLVQLGFRNIRISKFKFFFFPPVRSVLAQK
jgi:ubiquinone/menaquinone biosynthesis C-methylase UbiE